MASHRGRSTSPQKGSPRAGRSHATDDDDHDSLLNSRQLEAFGRTVHATATQLLGANFASESTSAAHDAYRSALSTVHQSMRQPLRQRSIFNLAKANPRQLIRSNLTSEIEHRAITWLPDELLRNVPVHSNPFSLFEGFKASLPDDSHEHLKKKGHGRRSSRSTKLLEAASDDEKGAPQVGKLRREKHRLDHRLEMMGIRKTMCASEIKEIDSKIANLNTMRRVTLDRLAGLEQEESDLEQEIAILADKVDEMQAEFEQQALATKAKSSQEETKEVDSTILEGDEDTPEFMSESVYQKLPRASAADATRAKRKKTTTKRTISMPILHEHMEPGSKIRDFQAHNDMITALDFDAPWGTLVTAALDDTVRVWDLNAGRCIGLLDGHLSSVRCLQVEDHFVATGSMDASIRLWDLSQAEYVPPIAPSKAEEQEALDGEDDTSGILTPAEEDEPAAHTNAALADCHIFTLSAHVAEVTALNFHRSTLVSGSADKTLRQWDLERGRCVQTLDVLWAAAQASSINPSISTSTSTRNNLSNPNNASWYRPAAGRVPAAEADFVGALQVFDTALACGTADGMVRLWDLRSGTVHRSLVGHTGPVTALQFDDVFLVTGSQDRSIRIWDLRTGTIHDAFAYENPISSMHFDARRIITAAGEDVVKVYDKADGNQWDCGAGAEGEEGERQSIVERVRIKDGYLVEGRKNGVVGVWSC